jgi:hypothetical protein
MNKKGRRWLIFLVIFFIGWSLSIALAYLFIRDMIWATALNLGIFSFVYGKLKADYSNVKSH